MVCPQLFRFLAQDFPHSKCTIFVGCSNDMGQFCNIQICDAEVQGRAWRCKLSWPR